MTTMREQMTADAAARFDAEERREGERFAKATKIDAEGYTGAVYCRCGPPSTSMVEDDGDESHMHLTVADFFDACREAGEEPPAWVWACVTETPRSDARWIVESALEDHHDGAGDVITKEHLAKLDAFLRAWWADSGVVSYRVDYKRVVMLRKAAT